MARKKKTAPVRRNPVVREGEVLRKGGPHTKSRGAVRVAEKRRLKRDSED